MAAEEYAKIDDSLKRLQADVEPAEAHGVLVGMLCAAGSLPLSRWVAEIAEVAEGDVLAGEAKKGLQAVYDAALGQLNDNAVSLVLLLPEDDQPLAERLQALGEWCQGFLYGYGVAGGRSPEQLSQETAEVLRDIHELANISAEVAEDDEDSESDFAEILEYLRVGVLTLRDELHPPVPASIRPQ